MGGSGVWFISCFVLLPILLICNIKISCYKLDLMTQPSPVRELTKEIHKFKASFGDLVGFCLKVKVVKIKGEVVSMGV